MVHIMINFFKKLWQWFLNLFVDKWEVTIYFAGEVVEKPDGSKSIGRNPKTYVCKKLKKVSDKHMKLVLEDGRSIEIKTVEPVGYDITKIQ